MIKGLRVLSPHVQRTLDLNGKDAIQVSWLGVVPGVVDLKQFNIYQSLGGKDYQKIGDSVIDSYEATDVTLIPSVDYWYKLTYVQSDNVESSLELATPISLYSYDEDGVTIYDQMARAQYLRSNWQLQNWGEEGKVWIRRFAGTRCPKCYDKEGGTSTDSRCPICYNTGWVDGYISFNQRIAVEMADQRYTHKQFGFELSQIPKVTVANFPILHSNDFIVRQDDTRFQITTVNQIKMRNILHQQVAFILSAQPDSIAYQLN